LPSDIGELRELPVGVQKINCHYIAEGLRDEHLSGLPDSLQYINSTGCKYLSSLDGLLNKTRLKRIDCMLCPLLTQKSVDDFHKALPNYRTSSLGMLAFAFDDRKRSRNVRQGT
jgi:hypothetical protein